MTDATFQPSLTTNKSAIAKKAILAEFAVSFSRVILNALPAKRPINADTALAAQARHETARRNVDNLLR